MNYAYYKGKVLLSCALLICSVVSEIAKREEQQEINGKVTGTSFQNTFLGKVADTNGNTVKNNFQNLGTDKLSYLPQTVFIVADDSNLQHSNYEEIPQNSKGNSWPSPVYEAIEEVAPPGIEGNRYDFSSNSHKWIPLMSMTSQPSTPTEEYKVNSEYSDRSDLEQGTSSSSVQADSHPTIGSKGFRPESDNWSKLRYGGAHSAIAILSNTASANNNQEYSNTLDNQLVNTPPSSFYSSHLDQIAVTGNGFQNTYTNTNDGSKTYPERYSTTILRPKQCPYIKHRTSPNYIQFPSKYNHQNMYRFQKAYQPGAPFIKLLLLPIDVDYNLFQPPKSNVTCARGGGMCDNFGKLQHMRKAFNYPPLSPPQQSNSNSGLRGYTAMKRRADNPYANRGTPNTVYGGLGNAILPKITQTITPGNLHCSGLRRTLTLPATISNIASFGFASSGISTYAKD